MGDPVYRQEVNGAVNLMRARYCRFQTYGTILQIFLARDMEFKVLTEVYIHLY